MHTPHHTSHMYVCTHAHTPHTPCTHTPQHMHTCMYTCTHTPHHMHTCMYTCTHTTQHTYTHTTPHAHMYVHMYKHTTPYTYAHTTTPHAFMHTCTHRETDWDWGVILQSKRNWKKEPNDWLTRSPTSSTQPYIITEPNSNSMPGTTLSPFVSANFNCLFTS